jgi:O-antigen/teichoic acid export membrane protein
LSSNSADTAIEPASRRPGLRLRLRGWLSRLAGGHGTGTVVRHMLVLAAGSGAAKLISLVSTPIITRLYSPGQYGLFMLFMASIALLAPLASLRYSAALPLPRRERSAVALLWACLLLLCAFVELLAVLFSLWAEPLFGLLSARSLAPYWPLFLMAVSTAGLYEILTNWSMRRKAFRVMVKAEVSQAVLGGAIKIGFGLAALQRVGLFVGHIAAQSIACLLLAAGAWREARRHLRRPVLHLSKRLVARYSAFPKYRLPSQLLLNFGQQAPLLFVSAVYGTATAGQLGLALVALALPLALVGQTTGQAYYAEIARIGRGDPDRIRRISRGVMVRLLGLGIGPTVVLMAGGAWLFPLVFGARWHDAGIFASILSLYLLAQFVANPLSHALNVFDKQHIYLRLNVVRTSMIVGIFALAHVLELSAYEAIAAYSVGLSIQYVMTTVTIFSVMREAKDRSARPGRPR